MVCVDTGGLLPHLSGKCVGACVMVRGCALIITRPMVAIACWRHRALAALRPGIVRVDCRGCGQRFMGSHRRCCDRDNTEGLARIQRWAGGGARRHHVGAGRSKALPPTKQLFEGNADWRTLAQDRAEWCRISASFAARHMSMRNTTFGAARCKADA